MQDAPLFRDLLQNGGGAFKNLMHYASVANLSKLVSSGKRLLVMSQRARIAGPG